MLAAVYLLWAFQRAFMGRPIGPNLKLPDIKLREACAVLPLIGLSLFLGIYPTPVLERLEPSTTRVLCQVEVATGQREPVVAIAHSGRGGFVPESSVKQTAARLQARAQRDRCAKVGVK